MIITNANNGQDVQTAFNKGNTNLMNGNFEESLFEFDLAAALSPENADIYLARGIAKEKLLQWQGAIDDYKKANELIKKRPFANDDATAFSNLANAETGLERWDAALKDFSYAAKLAPDFLAPQIGKALVLYQLDR